MSLRQVIEEEMGARGPIPFSRYMELCLYHSELGYYSRSADQFGKAGDFYTSSDVHAVFGRLLARQFEEIWRALGSPAEIEVLELGPGRGLFAQDVLDWSEKKFPQFFRALHYSLAERSPALRARIREVLARFIESGKVSSISATAAEKDEHRVLRPWFSAGSSSTSKTLPRDSSDSFYTTVEKSQAGTSMVVPGSVMNDRALTPDVPIVIFANEFFDALPVEILSQQGALRISAQDGRLVETWVAPSAEELEFLDRYGVHPEPGERIEVPLLANQYMARSPHPYARASSSRWTTAILARNS